LSSHSSPDVIYLNLRHSPTSAPLAFWCDEVREKEKEREKERRRREEKRRELKKRRRKERDRDRDREQIQREKTKKINFCPISLFKKKLFFFLSS
jgi:hypothetical protein